jgi:hypothetical protein
VRVRRNTEERRREIMILLSTAIEWGPKSRRTLLQHWPKINAPALRPFK